MEPEDKLLVGVIAAVVIGFMLVFILIAVALIVEAAHGCQP